MSVPNASKSMRSKRSTHPDDVVHQRQLEHRVQLELLVLQDVLQRALRTVLGQNAAVGLLNAGAHKAHQMLVLQVFHLAPKKTAVYT